MTKVTMNLSSGSQTVLINCETMPNVLHIVTLAADNRPLELVKKFNDAMVGPYTEWGGTDFKSCQACVETRSGRESVF